MLRRIIVEQVAAMMVLPNKLPIKLSEEVASTTLKFPEPEVGWRFLTMFKIVMVNTVKAAPYVIVNPKASRRTYKYEGLHTLHNIGGPVSPPLDLAQLATFLVV